MNTFLISFGLETQSISVASCNC